MHSTPFAHFPLPLSFSLALSCSLSFSSIFSPRFPGQLYLLLLELNVDEKEEPEKEE